MFFYSNKHVLNFCTVQFYTICCSLAESLRFLLYNKSGSVYAEQFHLQTSPSDQKSLFVKPNIRLRLCERF